MKDKSGASVYGPQSTRSETVARETFQLLLTALSNPGRIFTLPGQHFSTRQNCQQIGLTLLDLETSFYTSDLALSTALYRTGARPLPAANAAYLFFPDSVAFTGLATTQTLAEIEQAMIGTITDPDEGATLIIACSFGEGLRLHCTGPGIQETVELCIDGLPRQFWEVRAAKIRYPLGIDLFLVDDNQIVGLPRTTTVEL